MPSPPKASPLAAERLRKLTEEADNVALKNKILRGEVIDKAALLKALEGIFAAVTQIIQASPLPAKDKADILENISTYPVAVQNVADRQTKQVKFKAESEK